MSGDGMTEIDVKCSECDRDLKHICPKAYVEFRKTINYICHICAAKIPLAAPGETVKLSDVMREITQSDESVVFGRNYVGR